MKRTISFIPKTTRGIIEKDDTQEQFQDLLEPSSASRFSSIVQATKRIKHADKLLETRQEQIKK